MILGCTKRPVEGCAGGNNEMVAADTSTPRDDFNSLPLSRER